VHDQDAYVVDQAAIGSFTQIGWEAPTSNYFRYEEDEGAAGKWKATPLTKGPNCETP